MPSNLGKNAGEESTNVKIIRVTSGDEYNRFFGNILTSLKNTRNGDIELFSVKVLTMNSQNAIANLSDRLSINKFEATVNHADKTISFGPGQGIELEEGLRGKGIGSYAMNEIIYSLKKYCPNYTFIDYEVTLDEEALDKKDRLAQFLTNLGFELTFDDDNPKTAIIHGTTPSQLVTSYNEQKILELDMEEYILKLASESANADKEVSVLKQEVERLSEDTFNGITKDKLIKYTVIACGITVLLILAVAF